MMCELLGAMTQSPEHTGRVEVKESRGLRMTNLKLSPHPLQQHKIKTEARAKLQTEAQTLSSFQTEAAEGSKFHLTGCVAYVDGC
jgi:hypothetical protein